MKADLQSSSLQFKRGANQVRKEMWWKDMKMKLVAASLVGIIIVIIIIGNWGLCSGVPKVNISPWFSQLWLKESLITRPSLSILRLITILVFL